ncbi:membrane protein insertase YidC [Alteriqipengyuania sp. WL0013]|uniref:membrane protein insertase YidC n=1 Tax=Alteriqipengyuania sp. WL0013 TaxID=3110773 RepID=UPI002D19B672|nr:membrane protein insertase YidC [Alteriqipengyuania sp. WL0013]MEB3416607.1 membrane protein insertase YidC [Alteriqipengyuania sp. WL0013]
MDNQRNLFLTIALCAALLLGWDLVMQRLYPQPEVMATEGRADTPAERAAANTETGDVGSTPVAAPVDLGQALGSAGRVRIDAPEVTGSINPVGARIDDISLKTHRQEVEKDSGPVRLFAPAGTPAQQFAQFGWVGEGVRVPDGQTVWTAEGGTLSPGNPVTLRWNNGQGQLFTIALAIDEHYMITAEQTVANTSGGPIVLRPYASIVRDSGSASQDLWLVHSGPIGAFDGSVEFGNDYDDVAEAGLVTPAGRADWLGFTDVYWLSALVPEAGARTEANFRSFGGGLFRSGMIYDPVTVADGRQVSRTTKLFAGAKETEVLDMYEADGIPNFGLAIDWGWFRWFEKPIFWVLRQLFYLFGNFGVAIIALTFIIRGLMFPIAQKQFKSFAAMRAIQPKMKAIQERYKDDKQKQQQEIMELYKREKVNPLAGCLPLLLQMPIFFALYKVLILAIEMRHQPFALWIKDLSARDPANLANLMEAMGITVPGFLMFFFGIGVLALILGITMYLQFKLNPSQMDPAQQKIFMFMPWILMFVMAPFAAGLLLYWATSNILTIAQQWFLYSRHPQLKAQADKDKADAERAAAREARGKS